MMIESLLIDHLSYLGLQENLKNTVLKHFKNIYKGDTATPLSNVQQELFFELPEEIIDKDFGLLSICDGNLQITKHAAQESRIAKVLNRRAKWQLNNNRNPSFNVSNLSPTSDRSQLQAINDSIFRNLSIITGGPGSGKTRTAAAVIAAKCEATDEHLGMPDICLLAPTGKSAIRLTEGFIEALNNLNIKTQTRKLLRLKAKTIHSQLNLINKFDILLIDEFSMVSLEIMDTILQKIEKTTQLVLLGDPNQLPSIDAGNILVDICNSKSMKSSISRLMGQHRVQKNSNLFELHEKCRNGEIKDFVKQLRNDPNITWLNYSQPGVIYNFLIQNFKTYFEAWLKKEEKSEYEFQCLTAISSGLFGRNSINEIARKLNKRIGLKGVGDRILITQNQSSLDLSNGDIGSLLDSESVPSRRLQIDKTDNTIWLSQVICPNYAYAISIHRSQGSEYKHSLIALPDPALNSQMILTRELLYTAITRSKEKISIIGEEKQIASALVNRTNRKTCLNFYLESF